MSRMDDGCTSLYKNRILNNAIIVIIIVEETPINEETEGRWRSWHAATLMGRKRRSSRYNHDDDNAKRDRKFPAMMKFPVS